jgi:hypothetical protein
MRVKNCNVLNTHAMEAYRRSESIATLILNLGNRWSEWSISRYSRFTPRERASSIDWAERLHTIKSLSQYVE